MESDGPAERSLDVDFDEVARFFAEIRPVVANVTNVREFVALVRVITEKVFWKYFEFPNSRLYKPEQLGLLIPHVMDCINSITPKQIPYESISVDGKWILVAKIQDKSSGSKPN